MMPIHVNAIQRSREGGPQFVLYKGALMERTSSRDKARKYIKEGYKVSAKYINGSGYYYYKIEDEETIKSIFRFLQSNGVGIWGQCEALTLSFQEYFTKSCKAEGLNVDLGLFESGKKPVTIRIANEVANKLLEMVNFVIGLNQDSEFLIGRSS